MVLQNGTDISSLQILRVDWVIGFGLNIISDSKIVVATIIALVEKGEAVNFEPMRNRYKIIFIYYNFIIIISIFIVIIMIINIIIAINIINKLSSLSSN